MINPFRCRTTTFKSNYLRTLRCTRWHFHVWRVFGMHKNDVYAWTEGNPWLMQKWHRCSRCFR